MKQGNIVYVAGQFKPDPLLLPNGQHRLGVVKSVEKDPEDNLICIVDFGKGLILKYEADDLTRVEVQAEKTI